MTEKTEKNTRDAVARSLISESNLVGDGGEASLPDEPFPNFGAFNSVARHSYTTHSSSIHGNCERARRVERKRGKRKREREREKPWSGIIEIDRVAGERRILSLHLAFFYTEKQQQQLRLQKKQRKREKEKQLTADRKTSKLTTPAY